MVDEQWRTVPGYGNYEVSDAGRVRSQRRVLAQPRDQLGRPVVNLTADCGRRKVLRVHQLVARAFIGPRPSGLVTCHNNGDASDNRVENLRYDTQASNLRDRVDHGTDNTGERNGMCRLTDDQVREVRQLYVGRHHLTDNRKWASNAAELAQRFGISEDYLKAVATGRRRQLGGNVGRHIRRDRLEKIRRRERNER